MSPLLDHLLELDAPARLTRLAELAASDALLAAEASALLGVDSAARAHRFFGGDRAG